MIVDTSNSVGKSGGSSPSPPQLKYNIENVPLCWKIM